MPEFSIWGVLAAAVSSFLLGGLWYSPVLFAKAWQREVGLSDAELRNTNMVRVFVLSFVLSLLAAGMFAMFLGPRPSILFALGAGFAAGLFWVATSFGINYLFARRSLKLFLIDGGYHTLQFTLIGLMLGVIH